jgi:hypothetical protein
MAFNFLLNRLNTYPLNRLDKNNELKIINQIAKENDYHPISKTFNTNTKEKLRTSYKKTRRQKMGNVHLHRKRNTIYNEVV